MQLAITLVYCLWCRVQCLQGATVMALNDNDGFGGVWRAVMLKLQVSYTSTKHQLPIFCISTPPLCSDSEMFISCSFISYYQLFGRRSTHILHIDPLKFFHLSGCRHFSLQSHFSYQIHTLGTPAYINNSLTQMFPPPLSILIREGSPNWSTTAENADNTVDARLLLATHND